MNPPGPPIRVDSVRFQCAFVALGYALDRRGVDLLANLASPCAVAQALVDRLGHPVRHYRAQALATGLSPIVEALAARRLRCR